MMTMKFGGVLITGLAAFLLTNKALNVIDNSTKRLSEASKWKNYYKCWSKGQATSEPIAPGYSVTTSSGMGDTDGDHIIKDPYGKDHGVQSNKDRDLANAIVEACKGVVEKSIDSLKKPSETQEGVSEGQTEASGSDILESLKGFDTKFYKLPDDAAPVDKEHGFDRKAEICKIANLIINMSKCGADSVEMQRAIKHSMVILDAEKYHLDYIQSYEDNGIGDLVKKYRTYDSKDTDEVVTEVDEDGNPIAGRYSWKETDDHETLD